MNPSLFSLPPAIAP